MRTIRAAKAGGFVLPSSGIAKISLFRAYVPPF